MKKNGVSQTSRLPRNLTKVIGGNINAMLAVEKEPILLEVSDEAVGGFPGVIRGIIPTPTDKPLVCTMGDTVFEDLFDDHRVVLGDRGFGTVVVKLDLRSIDTGEIHLKAFNMYITNGVGERHLVTSGGAGASKNLTGAGPKGF